MKHTGSRQHGGLVTPVRPKQARAPRKKPQRQPIPAQDPATEFGKRIRQLNRALYDRGDRAINWTRVHKLEQRIDHIVRAWEAPM